MKLPNIILLFLTIVIVASSCKKDNTPTGLNPDVFENSIKAIIHYDGTDTIPSAANFYHYDTQGRLRSYSIIDGDITTNSLSNYDSVVFTYPGTDTLPVQADVYDDLNGGADVAQKYYYYDDQRRLIKDSVNGEVGSSFAQYSSETYVYTPGLITITAYGSNVEQGTTQVYLTADSKNIARVVNNDPADPSGSGSINYQYNTGLANPFYLSNVGRNLYYFGSGFLVFSSAQNAASTLNITSTAGSAQATVSYSNIANSLPGKAVLSANGEVIYTEYYYYQQ